MGKSGVNKDVSGEGGILSLVVGIGVGEAETVGVGEVVAERRAVSSRGISLGKRIAAVAIRMALMSSSRQWPRMKNQMNLVCRPNTSPGVMPGDVRPPCIYGGLGGAEDGGAELTGGAGGVMLAAGGRFGHKRNMNIVYRKYKSTLRGTWQVWIRALRRTSHVY